MKTVYYQASISPANLIVLENGIIRKFLLEEKQQWDIGRTTPDIKKDISLESKIASRNHGKIQNINGSWYYIELGSLNGTYLNGKKIQTTANKVSNPIQLNNGDVLRINSKELNRLDNNGVWMLFSTETIGNEWKIKKIENKKCYIGRDREKNDIVIPLPYISKSHASVFYNDGKYYIEDCGSKAGTWINGYRIQGKVELYEKDLITICDITMIYTDGKLIYNIPRCKTDFVKEEKEIFEAEHNKIERPIVLQADIRTRKVPDNSGHGMKELIRDVKVNVREGALVALLGGTGAGKSTVMNCLNGMDTSGTEGKVLYKGVDLLKNFERMRALIGSVPQGEVFHETLTVEQELTHAAVHRLPGDTKKSEIKSRVDYTLHQLGIEAIRKNRISKCSGGERRRVNIGIELVADRQLLCMDEPDAGLDPGNKRKLFETLRSLAHDEGKTILVIIHDVSDIDLFDEIIIMNKVNNIGRLAFAGTPDDAREYFGVDIKDVYQLIAQNPEKYTLGRGIN